MRKRNAFTLIEILVVAGIVGLFLVFTVSALRSFQQVSRLENTAQEAVSVLRLAQNRTLASEGASQYGVSFDAASSPQRYILFEGSSFASRNPASDEVRELENAVEISVLGLAGGETVFERVTGIPSALGFVTFRLVDEPGRTASVSVLASGAIEEGVSPVPSDEDRLVDSRHAHVAYQGREINTSTEEIRLIFPDITFTIDIASNLQAGQLFWEGEVESEGETQALKVHTHLLNDPVLGTEFSVHRSRMENTKPVEMELSGDATGNLIEYDEAGITTQGTSIYAGAPNLQ